MNENIDLTKILKDCPKGFELYSTIFGPVKFVKLDLEDQEFQIIIKVGQNKATNSFTKEGKYFIQYVDAECCLFPSKDQRDWSKFTAPWYKKEKFDPKTLKPFDKVLVRNDYESEWQCDLFSHVSYDSNYELKMFPYKCMGCTYRYCIPYNDNTNHLVGKNEEAPEFYRYWED